MKATKRLKAGLIVLISFLIYYILFQYFGVVKTHLDRITHVGIVSYILTYVLIGIPIFIGTYLINGNSNVLADLGLGKGIVQGIAMALLFATPMLLGGLLFFQLHKDLEPEQLIASTLVAGLAEELFFRGFLFGQLFRHTPLGFLPSILGGAIIFAVGHLYQSKELSELIGVFAVTFLGAILFAWLYVEWNFNLWVPLFMHTFMNLAWALFDMAPNAGGHVNSNMLRALTIILAIATTILYRKRRLGKMAVNRSTLWWQSAYPKTDVTKQ
ncbi:MAG TPA: type II CAAX endopeptidase family protein [Flavipsychrobacter sp.]|nr:type II CAAX endopeptidase family protein [Flavipsychrobacter sp.]